jgi:predicted negative regulator of RcsB-dependent stress response
MGRRITRKQLKQKDEFVTVADTVFAWFNDNWRPVVAAAGFVLFVYLIWWLATWWSSDRAMAASISLAEAVEIVEALDDPAAAGSDTEATPEAAEQKLREVIDSHGGTDQGDMARLYLAKLLLDRDETEEARTILVRLMEQHRGDTVGRLAAYNLIHLRIASGQAAEVAQELEEMVAGKDERLPRDMALYELGMIHVKQRNHEKARQYLEMLTEEFPESSYWRPANEQLSKLG